MIKHHPSPEQLVDYASGSMTMSHAYCVSAHLQFCETCRRNLQKCTEIGTQLFSMTEANALPVNDGELKESVLAMLDEEIKDEGLSEEANLSSENYSQKLKDVMDADYQQLDWSRVSPSIRLATLLHDKDGSQIALSRTQAGGKMPHHSHTGDEITVVLKGSFSDEDGLYSQGDFIFRDAHDKHSPIVTNDGECICLMVLDAPIQFTGFFTRWLNPLVRKHHAGH